MIVIDDIFNCQRDSELLNLEINYILNIFKIAMCNCIEVCYQFVTITVNGVS